ncbi:hypothetical protein J6590_043205 [Homalodisca vitripennis]|nr:hypothetical protein J6590_043205 [Homalodisca vitripennis]
MATPVKRLTVTTSLQHATPRHSPAAAKASPRTPVTSNPTSPCTPTAFSPVGVVKINRVRSSTELCYMQRRCCLEINEAEGAIAGYPDEFSSKNSSTSPMAGNSKVTPYRELKYRVSPQRTRHSVALAQLQYSDNMYDTVNCRVSPKFWPAESSRRSLNMEDLPE